ncbi:hypothetical protein RJ640_028275 [Escallonia rubra]|uniref:Uncharacterized protein n=1 Tax=Escallonia rubra TaxID=112253 RepID=A0AA88QLP1_9ASTE|nr:hypothetical protein RJ640_028275 [Escallonia rubra]
MKFMLNEQELEEHLTKEMVASTEAQPLRDHTAYQKWNQKDCSARYTLLSSLQNDLIGQYDELPTCKALWEQLKFSFGGTSTTRLRSLVIKFEEYTKDPKHTMSEHLRVMSNMIGKLRDAGHALTDEQQVKAVIRGNKLDIFLDDVLFGHGFRVDSLFQLDLIDSQSSYSYVMNDNIMNDSTTWHARLGHIGQDRMTRLAREGFLGPLAKVNLQTCEACLAESDFPSIGDASKNLDLYELEEVEPTLPSPSEGGELVPRPFVAEDSVSDLQPSGSIPDSGSTPQGPLGQQDSQLRRVGNDMSFIVATKQWMSSTFEMKDMGEANYVLGVKIVRDRSKRLLGLSQETYIKKVIERFRMHNSKPIDTPMDKACTLTTDQCPKNDEEKNRMSKVPYAAAVGSLMYVMLCTRPDICYAVGMDWGANRDKRISTSSGAISWCSKKKSCIALSTMESENAACSAAIQEAV